MLLIRLALILTIILAVLSSYALTFRTGLKAGESAVTARVNRETAALQEWAAAARERENLNLEKALNDIAKDNRDGGLAPVLVDQLKRMHKPVN